MRILIVEDNKDIVANIYEYFEPLGYTVDSASNGLSGLSLAIENSYDVIILDIMLPRLDGVQLCQRLRQELLLNTPIIMLTAKDTVEDKVTGLKNGADDYLIKPFSLVELEARLYALSRRVSHNYTKQLLTLGPLEFDPQTLALTREEKALQLKPLGYKILAILMKDSPKVFSRKELEYQLWGDSPPDSDALRTHIHTMRQVIDKPFSSPMIKTVQGIGYCMVTPK